MKKIVSLLLVAFSIISCSSQPATVIKPAGTSTAVPFAATASPVPPTSAATSTIPPTATVTAPAATVTATPVSYGPTGFPANVDPLTGLQVADPALLNRRPLLIKVTNLPRDSRPQWGLTQADLVYEYYTELGSTRFAAIYYGKDAPQVGPIRSARFFDDFLVRMYQAVFAFGSAYDAVYKYLFDQPYANRLVLEGEAPCPPMCRFEPEGRNYLIASTSELSKYATQQGYNSQQNLDGMFFQAQVPAEGQSLAQIYVRYSGAIYNRWDFDAARGRYLRYVDQQDDVDRNNEVYAPLVDRQNNQPVAADNLVVLFIPHSYFIRTKDSEVIKMDFTGSGTAFAFRDGKAYPIKWQRSNSDAIVGLTFEDGSPYPLKPGNTWFEVMGASTGLAKKDSNWRFTFAMP